MIAVKNVRKQYRVHKRSAGALAALRSVFHRTYETLTAVDDVSFDVAAGERVGLLGSNGAGKTTTLKVLSGLLHATSGEVRVAGLDPRRREHTFLRQISLVLGQRQRLMWDLPPCETFELHRVIQGISMGEYTSTLGELSELLDLGDLPKRPTRELALGERMKCELATALIHRPKVLFLDEPTIGLDVTMQVAVRSFIHRYNEQRGATVILTSHYMDDVVALCPRVLVMDHGRLAYDGPLDVLARRLRPEKLVTLHLHQPVEAKDLASLGALVKHEAREVVLRVDPSRIKEALADALARLPIHDLSVGDPPLEEIMAELFAGHEAARAKAHE